MNDLIKQEWYKLLVDDCKAIITEAVFVSRWALVEGYWNLGKRIADEQNFDRKEVYAGKIVQGLAQSIGVSKRTLHYALQAYDKYPDISTIPEGKNISWNKLITKYLPEHKEESEPIKMVEGTYNIIYADPPWQYNNSGFENSAESNYPTMDLQTICKLPIKELTTNSSVLFLWATNPLLTEAMQVLNEWGFQYKTNFVWVKDKARGWAWWAKSKHELLLVGTREETNTPETNYDSAFFEKREQNHSKKPEYVYEMIETMFPDSKYLELFQRVPRMGWDGWGNEL